MSEYDPAQRHIEHLALNDRRHIQEARKIRQDIRQDYHLPLLDRMVLGITGSASQLGIYKMLADRISNSHGEPIAQLNRRSPNELEVFGGIIAGEMVVVPHFSRNNDNSERGYAILTVPVTPLVMKRTGSRVSIHGYGEALRVGHFVMQENGYSVSQEEYVNNVELETVLIGRQALYGSRDFQNGIGDALLAIESYVTQAANVST